MQKKLYLFNSQVKLRTLVLGDKLCSVPVFPGLLVFAKVAGETLDTPCTHRRVANWCKGSGHLEQSGVLQGANQRSMATHAVTGNGSSALDYRQVLLHNTGQLFGDVRVHSVVGFVLLRGGVHVEAGSSAKVPVDILSLC